MAATQKQNEPLHYFWRPGVIYRFNEAIFFFDGTRLKVKKNNESTRFSSATRVLVYTHV